MMDKVFLQTINMSITSSYIIAFVIIIRFLLKKAPKIFSYGLWSVVFLRLIFPFSFKSIFSLLYINIKTIPQDIIYSQTPQIYSGITTIDRIVNNSLPEPTVLGSINPMEIWMMLGQILWCIGLGVLMIYNIVTTIQLSKKLKGARLISDNIYEANNIDTPFVFGIASPKIYLPTGLLETEKSYIIKHEQIHIQRFDHIIKLLAFLVVSIHWFNPLVWIAFSLMSKDMELSCDESVIKKMGSEIKKEYSNSLLALSTDRRIMGNSPLAFGENNTKGRIKNILNYKKPGFWAIVTVFFIVVVASVGLLSNPKEKKINAVEASNLVKESHELTIEEYAKKFVEQEIQMYEGSFKIIDSKIMRLEKLVRFENILSYPIELWSIEYRLQPENIDDVKVVGGMEVIDGWLTEQGSMGRPTLLFSYEDDKPKYLGNLNAVEHNTDTLAEQEISLRIFLEKIGLLSNETYKGNHVVIQFPLSTGETCQLLLSQPMTLGKKGIWVVERWMDGNGTIYYAELQEQLDRSKNLSLSDPLEVGYNYIIQDLGQINVKKSHLVPKFNVTIEDFMKILQSHYIGYITKLNLEEDIFHLDKAELLGLQDVERLEELNIDPEMDMPSGFYVYNPHSYPDGLVLSKETEYLLLQPPNFNTHTVASKVDLVEYLREVTYDPLFNIYTKDGYVTKIEEQYLP